MDEQPQCKTSRPRVAVYTRVSSTSRSTDNQVPEVEALAAIRGEIVARFYEARSAARVNAPSCSVVNSMFW